MSTHSRKSRRRRHHGRSRRSDYIITIDENAVFDFDNFDDEFSETTSTATRVSIDRSSIADEQPIQTSFQSRSNDDSSVNSRINESRKFSSPPPTTTTTTTTSSSSPSSSVGSDERSKGKIKAPSHLVMVLPLPPEAPNHPTLL